MWKGSSAGIDDVLLVSLALDLFTEGQHVKDLLEALKVKGKGWRVRGLSRANWAHVGHSLEGFEHSLVAIYVKQYSTQSAYLVNIYNEN